MLLSKAMKLLQLDYLGGHGSRGNGRVSFQNFQVIPYPETLNVDLDGIRQTFKPRSKSMNYFLLSWRLIRQSTSVVPTRRSAPSPLP